MTKSRRASVQVEPIEPRRLLSSLAPATRAVAGEVSVRVFPPPLLLTGEVRGTAVVRRGIPDVGTMYTLRGSGRVGPMGQVNAQGFLQTTSLSGRPLGTVTLANRFGAVQMKVTGLPTTADGTTTQVFNFEVTRATGRYARLAGTGGVMELTAGRTGDGGLANFRLGINPVVILSR